MSIINNPYKHYQPLSWKLLRMEVYLDLHLLLFSYLLFVARILLWEIVDDKLNWAFGVHWSVKVGVQNEWYAF